MTIKASINGPNRRRRTREGDNTVPSPDSPAANADNNNDSVATNAPATIQFRVKLLDAYHKEGSVGQERFVGNACLFTSNGDAGQELIRQHEAMVGNSNTKKGTSNSTDPLLIHFHDIPVFVLRAIPVQEEEEIKQQLSSEDKEDVLYLSRVQCHNHKICEDTVYQITCCSRIPQSTSTMTMKDYDMLSAVGIEVYLPTNRDSCSNLDPHVSDSSNVTPKQKPTFDAKEISKHLMNHTFDSILTVNELVVITIGDTGLVCRVSDVRVLRQDNEDDNTSGGGAITSAAEAIMDDPYRGRVCMDTEFYVSPTSSGSITITGERHLPEGKLPDDVVHITTSDMEWFPVRKVLLAPCIKLTRYVQAGRGKYKDVPTLSEEERSEDAPTDDGCPHCKVPIDCCTFDRVLLFLTSLLYPEEQRFVLDLSEINALTDAADALGLQPLADLCQSQSSSFDSRVRKDRFIRFAEVKKRNDENRELLIILDGMVLDITRWLDEHPGGPSIIPTQALNIDCTVFFEMYHVSRQAFLYLKSFYIGELSPEDRVDLKSSAEGAQASEGFLHSLRSYTDEWRIKITEKVDAKVHKSL